MLYKQNNKMQGTNYYSLKVQNWKKKAIARRKIIEALTKRIKELMSSRSNWKDKYKHVKLQLDDLKKENIRLKSQLECHQKGAIFTAGKAKHHSYGTVLIFMCMCLRQQSNCSLRGCVKMLKVMCLVLGMELSLPGKSSIQNWEKKLGYYRLTHPEKQGDWMIILDESISIGQQKLLLILGVNLQHYGFDKALQFSDMALLDLAISSSWKNEAISQRLNDLKAGGINIAYAVGDGGTNLVKGLKNSNIYRIADCTHAIGNLLKHQYNSNEEFLRFSKQCGVLKRQIQLSKYAKFSPPKQRIKGRFLNLQELSKWAYRLLNMLSDDSQQLDQQIYEKISWLKDYKTLVTAIYEQCQTMNQLFEILKKQGLSKASQQACLHLLDKSNCPDYFVQGVTKYLQTNVGLLKGRKKLICCSDIIESYFGKYKYMVSKNKNPMITDACLSIGNFNQKFDESVIKKALEKVKIVDLKQWKEKNCPTSILKSKQMLFKKSG